MQARSRFFGVKTLLPLGRASWGALALAALGMSARADVVEVKLPAIGVVADDELGTAVDIDGDFVVVGAARSDVNGVDSGEAYIFERGPSGWIERAQLEGDLFTQGDEFGASVAIYGDTVVVGAKQADAVDGTPDVGAAYVFVRHGTQWDREAKLIASDAGAADRFGWSVALYRNTLAVGAPHKSQPGPEGVVYVFERSGTDWTETAKIERNTPKPLAFFGEAVALHRDTVVIGSGGLDEAFVFVRDASGWIEEAKLMGSDTQSGDLFGQAVAVDGEFALVGAWADGSAGPNAGAVFLFRRSAGVWNEVVKLTASDAQPGDLLGHSVAIREGILVASAPQAQTSRNGAVYVFAPDTGNGWLEQVKLTASDGSSNDAFGFAARTTESAVVSGAIFADPGGTDSGAAYVYELESSVSYCTAKTNSCGTKPRVLATGLPSASNTAGFVISGVNVRSDRLGLLLYTNSGRAGIPFQGGTLCISLPCAGLLRRHLSVPRACAMHSGAST